MNSLQPSTTWKEIIDEDEAQRFRRQAENLKRVHESKNHAFGPGRFLHRETLIGAEATLTVHDGIPEFARQGIFSEPRTFSAVVRLSHGSFDMRANTRPDIRGFALQVNGVSGESSLGGSTDHQDFLFINHDYFAARNSDEFLEVTLVAAERGEAGLLFFLISRYGLSSALKRIRVLAATLGKPFRGYNAETFSTAVPVAIGPYAGKIRLRPLRPVERKTKDTALDMIGQLARGRIAYEMGLQFFTDEATTPIENPPMAWKEAASPFVPVATLTLQSSGLDVENLAFDPWGGLAAHRPLGEIMRARKGAYYLSQRARRVTSERAD